MLLAQAELDPARKTYDAAANMGLGMQQEQSQLYVALSDAFLRSSCLLQRLGNIISEAALLILQALATLKSHKVLYLQVCTNSRADILQHLLNLLSIIFHISLLQQAVVLVELHARGAP